MEQLTQLYPVYIGCSDGKATITVAKSKIEENRPTKAQLNGKSKNGDINQYKKVDLNSHKSIDWRLKLAGMLIKALQDTDQLTEKEKQHICRLYPFIVIAEVMSNSI